MSLILYKNRTIDTKIPVQVYRNLKHKDKVIYSIRQNNKVVGHTDSLTLKDVQFSVSESGRQRVLKTRHKNVHAWIKGYVILYPKQKTKLYAYNRVVYNPYLYSSFVKNRKPIIKTNKVILTDKGVYVTK